MYQDKSLNPLQIFKFGAFLGFLTASIFLVGMIHHWFEKVFDSRLRFLRFFLPFLLIFILVLLILIFEFFFVKRGVGLVDFD